MDRLHVVPVTEEPRLLRSFKPFVSPTSRVLILGSMPGPMALKKQQYYGFDGNHFWHILPTLFGETRPEAYRSRLAILRRNGVALWDVLESCTREGALDSRIKRPVVNKIPELLLAHPALKAIFINGRTAFNLFKRHVAPKIDRPYYYLPSTSPAHAAMSLQEKTREWAAIKKFL